MCNEWFATINLFPMCHLSLCTLQRTLQTKVGLKWLPFGYDVDDYNGNIVKCNRLEICNVQKEAGNYHIVKPLHLELTKYLRDH